MANIWITLVKKTHTDQFYTAYIRDDEDSSEEDDDDSDDDSSEDGDDSADGSVRASSPAKTEPEEVVPLSVELLIFPATKVEKEVIDAQKGLRITHLHDCH